MEKKICLTNSTQKQLGEKVVGLYQKMKFSLLSCDTPVQAISQLITKSADVCILFQEDLAEIKDSIMSIKEHGGEVVPIQGSAIDWNEKEISCVVGLERELTGGVREIIRRNFSQ